MNIISRAAAKSQQLPRYFTGKPCKHGHMSERNTHNGHCIECDRIRGAEYRIARPEVMIEWRKQNPTYASNKYHENREVRSEQNKKWYVDNKDYCLSRHKKWYYNEETQAKLIAWRQTWYATNREYDKQYRVANHDKLQAFRPAQRQRHAAKRKQQTQEKFQELAQIHTLPEIPKERDFKYWFAGEIIRRTGWFVYKEVFLDEEHTSKIDLLIPEAKLGIELKLSSHNWTKSHVSDQRDRYQQLLTNLGYTVLIISLDGSLGIDAKTWLENLSTSS